MVTTLELIDSRPAALADRIPPQAFFLVSAALHHLGPDFAVLLFAQVPVLGVAWLRIASAALVFALWRRPWRIFLRQSFEQRRTTVALGVVLGLMNASFYLAISRLPLGTVGAIEFIAPITLLIRVARAEDLSVSQTEFLVRFRLPEHARISSCPRHTHPSQCGGPGVGGARWLVADQPTL